MAVIGYHKFWGMHSQWRGAAWAGGLALAVLIPRVLSATDYQSDSFILRDPVISVEGGRSSSASFEYYSSTGQTDTGESTAASFIERAGFLYFPTVSSPSVSAQNGDTQVTLTWTATTAALGFTVSGYAVGQTTVSGGPYTFNNVGNVLTSTRTGLVNHTSYYFVIRTLDAFDNSIATSTQITAIPGPAGSGGGTPGSGGGGSAGGSGTQPPVSTLGQVVLRGYAFAAMPVTILRDGAPVATTNAAADGSFTFTVLDLTPGTYWFTVTAKDPVGRSSGTLAVSATAVAGATTAVSGIVVPPTLGADQREVRRGEPVGLDGYTAPGAEVSLLGEGTAGSFLALVPSEPSGQFHYQLDSARLQAGDLTLTARTAVDRIISTPSVGITLTIGERTVPSEPVVPCQVAADFNRDCRVSLADFSILLYWWRRPGVPAHVDLSRDGTVTLADFSIMIFYWTG